MKKILFELHYLDLDSHFLIRSLSRNHTPYVGPQSGGGGGRVSATISILFSLTSRGACAAAASGPETERREGDSQAYLSTILTLLF